MEKPFVLWLTGIPGSGKSTLAKALKKKLEKQRQIVILDADLLRKTVCCDLGFNNEDKIRNTLRIGHLAKILWLQNISSIVACVSPIALGRNMVRRLFPKNVYIEVLCFCNKKTSMSRKKALWNKWAKKKISGISGWDEEYGYGRPDWILRTDQDEAKECVDTLLWLIEEFDGKLK